MPILTYWLIPAEPARSHFVAMIHDLAARFDAPVFEPHVTVYVTPAEGENAVALLERGLAESHPYRLSITGFDFSDKFTKTLFVQFAEDEELKAVTARFRAASISHNEYELNPHLSLIYKTLPNEAKAEMVKSLSLPFDEVRFDSVKAVISPADIKSREDVEAWRVVATRSLRE